MSPPTSDRGVEWIHNLDLHFSMEADSELRDLACHGLFLVCQNASSPNQNFRIGRRPLAYTLVALWPEFLALAYDEQAMSVFLKGPCLVIDMDLRSVDSVVRTSHTKATSDWKRKLRYHRA